MLSNLSEACGCRLIAADGEIGRLEDCLFDERGWAVRFLVADAAGWLPERVALVPAAEMESPPADPDAMRVMLTREGVERESSCLAGELLPLGVEPFLRSARELIGFEVSAGGEDLGQVEDVLIDRASWTVRYVAVGPDRSALVSPDWLEDVDWLEASLQVDLAPEVLRTAPAPEKPNAVSRDYEERLYAHCRRPRYW